MMLRIQRGITVGKAVLIIAVTAAAIGGSLYLVTHPGESEEETQRAEAIEKHIRNLYPPGDVGYEITSRSKNRVKGFIYLKGEDDRVPFENFEVIRENNRWKINPMLYSLDTTVRSPSENLEITGYSIDKCNVGLPEWSREHTCLDKITPKVRNGSNYPAFVSSVHIKIENSTDTFTRSYPAGVILIRRISLGIVPSGRTVEVGYRGGPAPLAKWSSDGSKSFLRIDELAGENFKVTLTLKDGEGTTLAKRTFHVAFENTSIIPENEAVSEAKGILAESGVRAVENLVFEGAELRPPTEAEENVIESGVPIVGEGTSKSEEPGREAPDLIWEVRFSRPKPENGADIEKLESFIPQSFVLLLDPHTGKSLTLIRITV